MRLPDILFRDYLVKNEEEAYPYTYAIKFGATLNRGVNHIEVDNFKALEFGLVKEIQMMFDAGIIIRDMPKVVAMVTGLTDKDCYYMNIVKLCQSFAYIRSEIEEITEAEKVKLSRQLTDKEIRAGVDRFQEYSIYPQFRSVAQAFGMTISEVSKIPYHEAFLELCYQKDMAEYQDAYAKLK